jgi:hypothetical protein
MESQEMNERLLELEDKMNSIDLKLTQVVDAILGNPLTKTGGFINDIRELQNKVKEFEEKLEKHEKFKNQFSWTVGLVIMVGLIIQYFSNLYSNFK